MHCRFLRSFVYLTVTLLRVVKEDKNQVLVISGGITMANITWLEGNRIKIDPPKRTKKCTGTRFATILGLNPWSTDFEIWCAITKT